MTVAGNGIRSANAIINYFNPLIDALIRRRKIDTKLPTDKSKNPSVLIADNEIVRIQDDALVCQNLGIIVRPHETSHVW